LIGRKRPLEALISGLEGAVHYSEHLEKDGTRIYQNACKLQLDGIVSNRKNARYVSGRTANWLKLTCTPAAIAPPSTTDRA
jgi:bifunctional non-homologous end joining protein LigD